MEKQANGRFDYVRYDEFSVQQHTSLKAAFNTVATEVENILPAGQAKSLVMTHLEEAFMWVGKSIRDEQVAKRGAVLQEERTNL